MDVVFVRNLARDPQSRVARKLRPGNKLGFVLGSGKRIRRKGNRTTEISPGDALENAELLESGIAGSYIEVTNAEGDVLTAEAFKSMVQGKAPTVKAVVSEAPIEAPAVEEPEEEPTSASWTRNDLEQLNRSDLAALASERNIETKKVSKAKLVDLLLAGQED